MGIVNIVSHRLHIQDVWKPSTGMKLGREAVTFINCHRLLPLFEKELMKREFCWKTLQAFAAEFSEKM